MKTKKEYVFTKKWNNFFPRIQVKTKKKVFTKNGKHFFPQIQVKTKKKVLTKHGTLFSPNSSGLLPSDAHQSQIIGGMQDVDHTQTIGGETVKLLGGIYPPHPPRVSAPLYVRKCYLAVAKKVLVPNLLWNF